eukprot:GHVR01131935.1.p1 GENE.GHVR01131935.1~~GHVR01131935.1.p1  ORF type:complete len:255 (-),score=19.64 GHVR01131935.1:1074-1838(-)
MTRTNRYTPNPKAAQQLIIQRDHTLKVGVRPETVVGISQDEVTDRKAVVVTISDRLLISLTILSPEHSVENAYRVINSFLTKAESLTTLDAAHVLTSLGTFLTAYVSIDLAHCEQFGTLVFEQSDTTAEGYRNRWNQALAGLIPMVRTTKFFIVPRKTHPYCSALSLDQGARLLKEKEAFVSHSLMNLRWEVDDEEAKINDEAVIEFLGSLINSSEERACFLHNIFTRMFNCKGPPFGMLTVHLDRESLHLSRH